MNLGHLVDRERADPAADWNLLSLAEKQQLGVARLLLKSPSFAVLDEATSAMDAEVESDLFEKLKRSGITLVTVTHCASLLRFHERILTIKGGGERSWSLKAVEAGDEEGFASPRKTPVSRSATAQAQTDKDAQAAAYLAERSKSAGKGSASSAAGAASRPLPEVSDVRKAWMVIKLCVPTLSLADETVRQFIAFVVLMGAGTWIQTGFLSSTYGILRALAMESDLQKYVAFQGRIVSMRLLSLVSCHDIAGISGCILPRVPAISLRTGDQHAPAGGAVEDLDQLAGAHHQGHHRALHRQRKLLPDEACRP